MEEMVAQGTFRRDLYHRLRVGHLYLPPLRERLDDIPYLAHFFLTREAKKKKKQFRSISSDALVLLLEYPWPGNVRELENILERAVLLYDAPLLEPKHIRSLTAPPPGPQGSSLHFLSSVKKVPLVTRPASQPKYPAPGKPDEPVATSAANPDASGSSQLIIDMDRHTPLTLPSESLSLDALTNILIKAALDQFGGNKTKTAEYLGISRYALIRRLAKLPFDTERNTS